MSMEESFRDVPRHFAADEDLIGSHLAATLSAVFPDGEDFFVRSVRHFRDEITDPALKRQVAGFIGQEAVHGREHRDFNDRLDELGYPTKRIERIVKWQPRVPRAPLVARVQPGPHRRPRALHRHLGRARPHRARRPGRSSVTRPSCDLFVWHALEESEHKAVAFDVYKAVGGSERMRVFTMNFLCVVFISGMAVGVTASLLGDRATYRQGQSPPELAPLPPLPHHGPSRSGTSCVTTTDPTSTPTTATRPSSSSAGGRSSSARTAP